MWHTSENLRFIVCRPHPYIAHTRTYTHLCACQSDRLSVGSLLLKYIDPFALQFFHFHADGAKDNCVATSGKQKKKRQQLTFPHAISPLQWMPNVFMNCHFHCPTHCAAALCFDDMQAIYLADSDSASLSGICHITTNMAHQGKETVAGHGTLNQKNQQFGTARERQAPRECESNTKRASEHCLTDAVIVHSCRTASARRRRVALKFKDGSCCLFSSAFDVETCGRVLKTVAALPTLAD